MEIGKKGLTVVCQECILVVHVDDILQSRSQAAIRSPLCFPPVPSFSSDNIDTILSGAQVYLLSKVQ